MPTSPTRKTEHPWITRARAAGQPLVFAHRGGAALAPENTLAAFTRAHALGVDGFELDVRLSRDGEVMVIHDADVDRTTNGKGRVSALTSAELRTLDAGCRVKGSEGDTRIPFLRDILARFPDEMLIIELKGANPSLPPRAFEIVRDAGALDRVCFGGFQRHMLIGVRRCGRRHTSDRASDRTSDRLGVSAVCSSASREETRWSLYRSWVRFPWPWRPYDAFQVPEISRGTRVVSPEFVRAAHARDLLVQVWTVNDEQSMTRLLQWGVDGLITDRPDLALQARDAFVSALR